MTLTRLEGLAGAESPIVVTGNRHLALVGEELAGIGLEPRAVIVEPVGRNTAPAAIAAALVADEDEVLVILPSDHLIEDDEAFRSALGVAAAHAARGGIITFGIRPTRPETGYGYIEVGRALDGVFAVARFKEKPGPAEAGELAEDGKHLWNAGIFVVGAGQLLDEAEKQHPDLVGAVRAAMPDPHGQVVELGDGFADIDPISIDYAIMEGTTNALVLPLDAGWDDVGSYVSLLHAAERDADGNHSDGDVFLEDVTGSFVKATSRKVVVAGLEDVVVVETPEVVLVMPLNRSQEVRRIQHEVDPG